MDFLYNFKKNRDFPKYLKKKEKTYLRELSYDMSFSFDRNLYYHMCNMWVWFFIYHYILSNPTR